MEYKTDALVLRAVDYGENDKMVTLFTADRGKISAGMKGVRRAGARLRFAAQPFCFAEYVFAEKAGRYTVTGASLHDGFYALTQDIAAYYAAATVLEVCDGLLYEGMESGGLLIAAVSALGRLAEGAGAPALVNFLCEALKIAGYPVQAQAHCPVCGRALSGRLSFQFASGSFTCPECAEGAPASESTYRTLRAAERGEPLPEGDGAKRALRLLKAHYFHHTEGELASLTEYLGLL